MIERGLANMLFYGLIDILQGSHLAKIDCMGTLSNRATKLSKKMQATPPIAVPSGYYNSLLPTPIRVSCGQTW